MTIKYAKEAIIAMLRIKMVKCETQSLANDNFTAMYDTFSSAWKRFADDFSGFDLTHISLASHFWDIGKQCRPRSDAAERGV